MDIEGPEDCDLLVIGASLTGSAIARDASGRGIKVCLAERGDLAATAMPAALALGGVGSASGGLAALREAQAELARLRTAAPHALRPIRVIAPEPRRNWHPRALLGPQARVDLACAPHTALLRERLGKGREEADCWLDETRLVVLHCLDATERGASLRLHSPVTALKRRADHWEATLSTPHGQHRIDARAVINAAGPAAGEVLAMAFPGRAPHAPCLVSEGYAILPRLYHGAHGYGFAADDGAKLTLLPIGSDYTLLGFAGAPGAEQSQTPDVAAICAVAAPYLQVPLAPESVLAGCARLRCVTDAGVQATTDDAAPAFLTPGGGPLITHRLRAERALDRLGLANRRWTGRAPLPGGNIDWVRFDAFIADQQRRWPWLGPHNAARLARTYGTRMSRILGDAKSPRDLGTPLGGGLTSAELAYLATHEFARSAEDVLWRRSLLGLTLGAADQRRVAEWFARVALAH